MKTFAIALSLLGLVACGAQEKQSMTAGDEPSAAEEAAAGAEGMPPVSAPGPAGEATAADPAASCIRLVDERRFDEALAACTKAAGMDPQNQEVQAALARARAEVGGAALEGAGGAAEEAADHAASEAAEMEDALRKMPGPPPGLE